MNSNINPYNIGPFLNIESELESTLPNELSSHFQNLGKRYKAYGDHQREGLCKMFWLSFGVFRTHADDFAFAPQRKDTFSVKWLRRHILNDSKKVKKVISPYYDFNHFGGWKTGSQTKSYSLKEDVSKALVSVFSSNTPLPLKESNRNFDPDSRYLPDTSRISLSPSIRINFEHLDHEIRTLDEKLERNKKISTSGITKDGPVINILRKRNALLILRKISISMPEKGTAPNLYRRGEFGRLFGEGCNLQSIPKPIRKKLLTGKGLYDYDFTLCHPTLFYYLAQHYNLPCENINYYLKNRNAVIAHLKTLSRKSDTGSELSDEELKKLLTLLVYSSDTKSKSFRKSSFELFRKDALRIQSFHEDSVFMGIRNDFELNRMPLLEFLRRDSFRIFGKPFPEKATKSGRERIGSLMAFALQQLESELLEAACSPFNDIVLLCFDGWISGKREVEELEAYVSLKIEKKTAIYFDIKLKEDPI